MPVTPLQALIAQLLADNRSPDSYLAGGTAFHFEPNSIRFSQDLDYFHDSEKRVAEAFALDSKTLKDNGFDVSVELHQPGFIRAIVRREEASTKIEWAHDSAWRFMPTYFIADRGFTLHPIDLAINKVLALAGRDEPRDYLDVIHAHENILDLGGLIWAANGKDPGFTPNSLLELLQRKGKYRKEDFARLHLNIELDLPAMKENWRSALENSHKIIERLPTENVGCLFYDSRTKEFVVPKIPIDREVVPHYATNGGILPLVQTE